jgi:hypothetical protein
VAYALRAAVLLATRRRRWDDAIQTLEKDVERVRVAIVELGRA